jgi:hypothetical protein
VKNNCGWQIQITESVNSVPIKPMCIYFYGFCLFVFKASRAIRKTQFTQKRVAYKILLFETTSLKIPNLLKMVSHLLLTVLTNFSRPVRNVMLNVLSGQRFVICSFCLGQLRGSLQRRKIRIYDS